MPITRRDALSSEPTPRKDPMRKAVPKGNSAGRPTLDELERRKTKVMQIATELFVREGYTATSLADIAKSAGVATRTLYQHFGDKKAIFHNVMFAPTPAAAFPLANVADNETLFGALMRTAEYVRDVSFDPTTVDMMRLAIAESRRFPDMMQRLIAGSHARFNEKIRQVFDQFVARRMVQDDDTEASAEMFIHLILGDTPLLIFGGWKAALPRTENLTEKVDLFMRGRRGYRSEENTPAVGRSRRTAPLPD
jgi:TetR/AcrR family transcriptional repressor of mexJK operon